MPRILALLLPAALALAACGPSPEAQREAARAATEARIAPYATSFEQALAAGDFVQAKRLSDLILHDAPDSAVAGRIRGLLPDLATKAAAQAEQQRLQAAWRYQSHLIDGHATPQRSASIHNQRRPDEPRVQLVLRNDPRWGRSAYLVIEEGEFGCGRPCAFRIAPEGAAEQRLVAEATSTGTHPAFFINDEQAFIDLLAKAPAMTLRAADGSGTTLRFEAGGYDAPRWERGR